MISAITALTAGVISEGLGMTVSPAASADTMGPKHRFSRKFQGATISERPRGWYSIQLLVNADAMVGHTLVGFIHFFRLPMAWRISSSTGMNSVASTSADGLR